MDAYDMGKPIVFDMDRYQILKREFQKFLVGRGLTKKGAVCYQIVNRVFQFVYFSHSRSKDEARIEVFVRYPCNEFPDSKVLTSGNDVINRLETIEYRGGFNLRPWLTCDPKIDLHENLNALFEAADRSLFPFMEHLSDPDRLKAYICDSNEELETTKRFYWAVSSRQTYERFCK